MSYQDLSQTQLQDKAKAAGIPAFGTKTQLIERLEAHDAGDTAIAQEQPDTTPDEALTVMATAQQSATVVVPAAPSILTPTANDMVSYSTTSDAGKQTMEYAQRVLSKIKAKYPQLNVSIDPHQEVYVFDGGIQRRVTTTIHQPEEALLRDKVGVASSYVQGDQAGRMAKNSFSGADGDFGQQFMTGVE